ncbi:MAG: amidohydrolase [Bdellovibrionales bacterium]
MRIEACFDSHVHWPFTGEISHRLSLAHLKKSRDVLDLKPAAGHLRGEWILGFGWQDTDWPEPPHRSVLDEWSKAPVVLSRCDGHAVWVNTETLKRCKIWDMKQDPAGGRIVREANGDPTGVLLDTAADLVHAQVPSLTAFEMRRNLLKGVRMFNEVGYTHIRDMTCDELQWNEAVHLDQSGALTLAVEEFFWLKSADVLNETVSLAIRAQRSQTPNLRAKGLKLFLDGALGSEGAYLSRCYSHSENRGLKIWDTSSLEAVVRKVAEENLELAVHAIGDEAADEFVNLALKLHEQGIAGIWHLEHAELLRSDTVKKMVGLNITCHLQPSHWLSDRKWLENKIGDLIRDAFPWRKLQEAGIPFFFGSDAPIEPASVARCLQALSESAEAGIPRLLGDPTSHMIHPDRAWAPNSFSVFDGDRPSHVVFRGEDLI